MPASTSPSWDLWRCPVCRASHRQPHPACRRCGADLMRLVKLRLAARHAAARGAHDQARVLARDEIGADGGSAGGAPSDCDETGADGSPNGAA